jgi:hypothetical protein
MTYFAEALFVTFFITPVASAPFEFDPLLVAAWFAIQSLRIFGPLGGPKTANLECLNQLKEDLQKNELTRDRQCPPKRHFQLQLELDLLCDQ